MPQHNDTKDGTNVGSPDADTDAKQHRATELPAKSHSYSALTGQLLPVSRRHFVKGTLASSVVVSGLSSVACSAIAQSAGEQDWPQFRFNTANTGYNPDATGPKQNVHEKWRFSTGLGYLPAGGSPAVVNDTVYVGGGDGNVYALKISDGTERWRFNAATGEGDYLASGPAVVDGTVYVGGGLNSNLYALEASSGSERWHFNVGSGSVVSSPAVVDGTVYVGGGNRNNNVYALDASSGAERWRFSTGDGVVGGSPAVVDRIVYICGSGTMYALEASSGSERWRFNVDPGYVEDSPAVGDGTVYVGSAVGGAESGNGSVHAVGVSSGTEHWRFDTGGFANDPAVVEDTVYGGGGDGNVYALESSSGTERWRFDVGNIVNFGPVVTDGIVYVGGTNRNGTVYALEASSRTEYWHFDMVNGIASTPVVTGRTVYFGSDNGNVFAIEGETSSNGGGPANRSPTADFTYSPENPEATYETEFDASASSDSDGSITTYEWNFDSQNGYEKTGVTVTYTFSQPGRVTTSLRITDDDGATDEVEKQVPINVAGTSSRLDLANEIEEKTVSDLHHVRPVTEKMNAINERVKAGDIPPDVATEAVERLIIGERFTKSTLNALGPSTYSRKDFHNDYFDQREIDFASRNADVIVNILTELALMGLSVGGRTTEYLSKHADSAWAVALAESVGATIDGLVSKVIGFVASRSENVANNAKTETSGAADDVFEKISEGALSGASEIETYIDEQMSELKTGIAEGLRRSVERPLEERDGFIDPDPTTELYWNGIDRGVENLNIVLGPNRLEQEGVSGSTDGAGRAVSSGLDDMNTRLEVAYRTMSNIQDLLDNLNISANIEKLIMAVENGDGVEAVMSLLQTIAGIVSGAAGVVSQLFSAQLGQTTMAELANTHYRTLDGVAHGGSEG